MVANQKESSPQFLLVHTDVLIILKPDVPHRNPEKKIMHICGIWTSHIFSEKSKQVRFFF